MAAATQDMEQGIERSSFGALFLAAIGVVFGDIGTSPLYAMKEAFAGPHPLPVDHLHVLGVLSLVFWTVLLVVTVKYVSVIMRADNKGEGGSLALLALLQQAVSDRPRLAALAGTLGIFAAALFYGDSAITPAVSVLSAVEGLQVAAPALAPWAVPLAIVILIILFSVQSKGSGAVGGLFGTVMLVWFAALAVLGIRNIGQAPSVLAALSPHWAFAFIAHDGWTGFLALGSVVLSVTGAEALYADMGHFGRLPIRLAWYLLVWPALMLNYFGQGALLLAHPEVAENLFFVMAPTWMAPALVILATAATVIASQAVISGAFSVTRQAIQLGYLPRMSIVHTSEREIGQIYIPFVNWTLMLVVVGLVLGFGTSTNLASAYGMAVTGTMVITTALVALLAFNLWGWRGKWAWALLLLLLSVDIAYFLATATKITHGGWFPLAAGIAVFLVLTTWKKGRKLVQAKLRDESMPIEEFLSTLSSTVTRVPGTAVFLTSAAEGVPLALLHNLKHNHVLHERVVLLTVKVEETPTVPGCDRVRSEQLRDDVFRVTVRCGFMEDTDVPKALANARRADLGFDYEPLRFSYFLTRETVVPSRDPGMEPWRERLFAFLSRSATTTADFFHLPPNRVVELGGHVEI
ncbi:potassium transporter Kup [Oleisolibacter albus]|uniref:potassium transporter Kup n=1 Tax=Oleisolibacter albus TaxID=2171757 RepID=UPI001EFE8337|nr:potassium transporter Kup [Oleisolibacter albus]